MKNLVFIVFISVTSALMGSDIARADITTGLVGHWTFDEGQGTVAHDSTGHGYDGTLQSTTQGASLPAWIAGNGTSGSGALHFVGNGASVSIPTLPFSNAFSLSLWIRNDANTQNVGPTDAISWGWYVSLSYASKALNFTVAGDSSKVISSACVNAGNSNSGWHHIVAIDDGSTQSLYCDDVLIGNSSYTPSGNGATGAGMYLAATTGGGGYYNGYMNDVRLYNRVLTVPDINTLFTTGVQPNLGPLPNPTVQTANLFIAQSAQGVQDGSSCANAQSVAWLDNSGNWGNSSGQIGSGGGTINLCGIISQSVYIYNGGTSALPLTVLFQKGAKISQAAGTGIVLSSSAGYGTSISYLTIDGGTNGIIENTDNGTAGVTNPSTGNPYGNQVATSGIYASYAANFEVKNLTMQNLYVHASANDGSIDFTSGGGVYLGNFGSNISIHDNTFHDICWIIIGAGASGASGFNVYNNNFYNYDHAIGGIGGAMANPANVNIYNNHFGSTANWDSTANSYHHDGIHIYFPPGGSISGVNVYNNLFDGNWGSDNTAHIFFEGDWSHPSYSTMNNFNIYNNVFIQYPNNYLNDGFIAGGGLNWSIYNNTFLGSGVTNSACFEVGSYGGMAFKNNILSGCTSFLGMPGGAGNDFDYNIYANATPGGNYPWGYGIYPSPLTTFSAWQQFSGLDVHSSYVSNAGLDSTGHPLAGSAVIGAGINLSSVGLTGLNADKNAVLRSSTWDIGAYEFSAQSSVGSGDVSGNNMVTMYDAALVSQFTLGEIIFSPTQEASAEVTNDGVPSHADAVAIAQKALGL